MTERTRHKHSASTTPSSSVKLPTRYHTLRPTPSSPSTATTTHTRTTTATATADRSFTATSITYSPATSPKHTARTISLNTPKAATTKAKHHTSASTSLSPSAFYLSSLSQPHSASLFSTGSGGGYGTLNPSTARSVQASRPMPDTPTRSRPAYSATLNPSSPTTSLPIHSLPSAPINMTLPFTSSSAAVVPHCSACELPIAAHAKPVLITDKQTNETFSYHQEHFCCHACQQPLTTATLKRKQHTLYCPDHYPYPSCHHCQQLITGPSITALGRTYHPEHFTCAVCPAVITEAKFAHCDGKAYCATHYGELERQCALCALPVKVSGMKTTANKECYHTSCLACWVCGDSKGTMLRSKGRMYCQSHGSALLYHRCAECSQYIDKPVHAPNGQYYHQDCLRCAVCQSVMDGWHTKLGQLRCGKHADMRSEAKECARCARKVEGEEEVVKAMGRIYHSECYKCAQCDRRVDAKSCQLLDNTLCCVDCWLSKQPGQEGRRLPLSDNTSQHNNSKMPTLPALATHQRGASQAEGEQSKQSADSGGMVAPASPAVKAASINATVDLTDRLAEAIRLREHASESGQTDVKERAREHVRESSLSKSLDTSRLVQAIQGRTLPPLPLPPLPAPLNTSTASGTSEATVAASPSHAAMPAPSPPTTPNRTAAAKTFFHSPSLAPAVQQPPATPPLLPTTPPLPSTRPLSNPPSHSHSHSLSLSHPHSHTQHTPIQPQRPSTPTQVKLGDLIATGTFGSVYTALDQTTGEHLAVKVLKDDSDTLLLEQEVNLLKQLQHPNIVGFRGVREVEGKMHIYMEYVEGKSLVHQLARWGPFAEPLIRRYTRQLLSALAYCHDMRVTHRDIKGKNILMTTSGQVKLCDFGSAKKFVNDMTSEHPTKSYTFTVQWTAPEVVQGELKYNTKVDVWSLGCVVIEMASGRAPWSERMHEIGNQFRLLWIIGHTDDKPAIPASLSAECRQFVDLMLTKDPDRRPSARELLSHPWLREERAGIPQHVRSASAKEEQSSGSGVSGGGGGGRVVRGKGSISGEHRYAAVVEEQKEQLSSSGGSTAVVPAGGQQRRSHSALLHGISGLRLNEDR